MLKQIVLPACWKSLSQIQLSILRSKALKIEGLPIKENSLYSENLFHKP